MLHIVCPVYYEQDNIQKLWKELQAHLSFSFVIHFVYDTELDPTVPILRELEFEHPDKISLVHNPQRGVLAALKAGIQAVPSGVPLLVLMADLSDDLTVIPKMLQSWNSGASVVVASRYMKGGRQIGGPFIKRFLSELAGKSLYWLRRFPVHDATNNFRLYDSDFIHSLLIESKGGFELAFEITAKAVAQNKKVVEIPSTWRDRSSGTSKFKLMKWLPHYLKWYFFVLRSGMKRTQPQA